MSRKQCPNPWDVAIEVGVEFSEDEMLQMFKIGSMVDVKDPDTGKWLNGFIKAIERLSPT